MEIVSSITHCPKCKKKQAEFWVAIIKPIINLPKKKKRKIISAQCECGFHIDKISDKRIEKFAQKEF